jgi:hypothetical protein
MYDMSAKKRLELSKETNKIRVKHHDRTKINKAQSEKGKGG